MRLVLYKTLGLNRSCAVPYRQPLRIVLICSGLALALTAMLASSALAQGTAPDAPTAVAVYTLRSSELEVRWSSSNSASTTSFKIQWKSGSQEFDSARQLTSDPSTSVEALQSTSDGERYVDTITGLTDGVEHTVRIIATNSEGDSDPSEEVAGTPQSSPGQVDEFIETEVIELFESAHPWLRETWDYISAQSVTVTFHSPGGGEVFTECPEGRLEFNLRKCLATGVEVGRYQADIIYTITHELAHVYTLANGVAETPAPLGIANLYFVDLLPGSYDVLRSAGLIAWGCRPIELYADALTLLTLGTEVRASLFD